MPTHEQVEVDLTEQFGKQITVDKALLPILSTLWARGIRTFHSCQGGSDMYEGVGESLGYITFPPEHEATVRFLLLQAGVIITQIEFFPQVQPDRIAIRFKPIS